MIIISICLSDIPDFACKKSDSNGKIYANFVVDQRKEKDKFDNTHTVYVNQSKEERAEKKPKSYVGNGKEYKFEHSETPAVNPFANTQQDAKVYNQPDVPYEYSDNGQSDDNLPF